MSLTSKLKRKINTLLNKYKVYHGKVYKRTTQQSGGNSLLGKPGTVSKDDVEMFPPPAIFYPKYQGISENNDPVLVGGVAAQIGDVIFLVSIDAITESEVTDPSFCFAVITDQYEEEYYIISSDRVHVEENILVYQFLVRSRLRKP